MTTEIKEHQLFRLLTVRENLNNLPEYLAGVFDNEDARNSLFYLRDMENRFRLRIGGSSNLPGTLTTEELHRVVRLLEQESYADSDMLADALRSLESKWQMSMAGIPLMHNGELIGLWIAPVIPGVQNATLVQVAKYLSLGLHQHLVIHRFQTQNKRLKSLVEAGQIFTSQTRSKDVLQKLVDELHDRFNYSCIAVLLKEEDVLRIAAAKGFTQDDIVGTKISVDRGIVGKVTQEGADVNVGDVSKSDDYYTAGEPGIQSEMAVPIRLNDQLLGVLDAQDTSRNAFSAEDVEFLHVIARMAAVAIQNARLFGDLQRTEEYLTRIINSSGDAIFVIDRAGTIHTWNRGAERVYGYSQEEALGRNVDELVDPEKHDRSAEDVFHLVIEHQGVFHEDEVLRRRKNGETFPATATYTVLRDDSGGRMLSITEKDLTYIKQATKLDAARTLISTVTHYINNAITPLNGRAQIAQMNPSDENVSNLIDAAVEATEKIQEVLETISEMRQFITTPYYSDSSIINLEEELEKKLKKHAT